VVLRSTCYQGHDLTDPRNVWVARDGKRRLCRICKKASQEKFRERIVLSEEDKQPVPTAKRAALKARKNVKLAQEFLEKRKRQLAEAQASVKAELFAAAGRFHAAGVPSDSIRRELRRLCESDAEGDQIADAFFAGLSPAERL
jgi:hypothetical protein